MVMRASATQVCTTPCSDKGLPNGLRAWARRHISSRARSAAPIVRMQWWMRPGPRRAWAMANPPPSSPRRLDTGTRTSSNVMSTWPSASS